MIYQAKQFNKVWFFIISLLILFTFSCTTVKGINKLPVSIEYGKNKKQFKTPHQLPKKSIKNTFKFEKHIAIRNSKNPLSLKEAISLTLNHNPEFKIAAWQIRAKKMAELQSSLWINPELEIELENFGTSEIGLSLGQLIELGGKRASRIALAKIDQKNSLWNFEIKRLELIVAVSDQFSETMKIQKQLNHWQKSIELAKKTIRLSRFRKNAGVGTSLAVIQAEAALKQVQLAFEKTKRNLTLQKKILASSWGDKNANFAELNGKTIIPPHVASLNHLLSGHTKNNDMVQWLYEFEKHKYELKGTHADAWPDTSVKLGFVMKPADDENNIVLGLAFDLPIFNRNEGNIQETKFKLHIIKLQKKHIELKIANDLNRAYTHYKNNHMECVRYADDILPALRKVYKESARFFRMGRITSLELLNAQKELITVELAYLESVSEFQKSQNQIELLTGKPVTNFQGEKK